MTGKRRAEPVPRVGQHIPAVSPVEDPTDTRGKRAANRRPGPKHEAAEVADATPKAPRAPRVRVPKVPAVASVAPRSPSVSRVAPRVATPRLGASRRELAGHASDYATRAQTRSLMGGKPSVSGSAVAGGAAGAATGAALGSVVPGPGTAVGAGAGAALGGAGGALSGGKRKKAYKKATSSSPGSRRALVAEFTVCIAIIALSPLTDKHKTDAPADWMKRMAAAMGVFLVLALISAMGRGGARTAAAFGGLVAVVLAVSERDLFVKIADIFGGVPSGETASHAGEVKTA